MTEKTTNPQKSINRREMLKKGALATGAAVTAAVFLDGKWLKPVVKTGILPVHAQASVCAEYTFVPEFYWSDDPQPLQPLRLRVDVTPHGPDGPISYEIMGVTGFTLTPGVGSSGSSTLTGGTAYFLEEYVFENPVGPPFTITIKWSYDGCDYTQTYDLEDILPFI